ncbi:MAG: lipase chaperone [Burkholderiales bacterium]|nr:lipase chaperone [Burkholderiales bacterium]
MPGAIPQSGWKAGGSADASAPLALAELRRLFDQYLSSVDAQSVAVATQQIHAEMDRRLAPINVPKARRILGLYLEFKRELVNLERSLSLSGQHLHAVRNLVRAKHDLRARYFTAEEVQALFGLEDAYDMDAIARLEINQNPALTPEQKQEKLAALDATLPAMLRGRQAPPPVLQVEEKVYALRTQGASDDDVYRLRAKEVDPQAAARLAALDHEEAQWTRRIAQYLTERNQLLEAPETEADPDHKAALLDLQRDRFTEDERSRLSAYEQ